MKIHNRYKGAKLTLPNYPLLGITKQINCSACGYHYFDATVFQPNVEVPQLKVLAVCGYCGKEETFHKTDKLVIEGEESKT